MSESQENFDFLMQQRMRATMITDQTNILKANVNFMVMDHGERLADMERRL